MRAAAARVNAEAAGRSRDFRFSALPLHPCLCSYIQWWGDTHRLAPIALKAFTIGWLSQDALSPPAAAHPKGLLLFLRVSAVSLGIFGIRSVSNVNFLQDFLAAIRDRKDQARNASLKPSLAESAKILPEEPCTKHPCLLRRSTSSTSMSRPSRNTRTNELKVHVEGTRLLVSP